MGETTYKSVFTRSSRRLGEEEEEEEEDDDDDDDYDQGVPLAVTHSQLG